ncbi:hypothetical protein G6F37_010691 [Rhizopus arrhizus]|nr:hypothetical protein G6F38_010828 [Rhizopus arrhizus]KAG1153065.1 hypothetical protein G6F37_010691 [Rhizopus arrhizus]
MEQFDRQTVESFLQDVNAHHWNTTTNHYSSFSQSPFQDEQQPIKIKKKPGRKPNPASPALRKAQNRAAQRAFRERKERHLRELEVTIRQLREQRNNAFKELHETKSKMDAYRAENWYLKGVVLTLQFVCLHHHIHIPTHSPYLTEEALSDMAKTQPHAIEAYVNAYTKNNINLKPTMAAHFANAPMKSDSPKPAYQREMTEEYEEEEDEDEDDLEEQSVCVKREGSEQGGSHQMNDWVQEESEPKDKHEKKEDHPDPSSLSAIQHIRLQLRVQSTLTNVGQSAARLQPTILQLAIPHDPRIDLVPTPHMRDRMILFRDIMDYDRCFDMLLNGALYHGGDPTMSASWELPAEFFSEFWYLAINYDVNRTNTWRRLKNLPDIPVGLEEKRSNQADDTGTVWTDDVFSQITTEMPTLQPLDIHHFTSGFDFGSPNHHMMGDGSTLSIYDQFNNTRDTRSSSIGTMMELMNTLSTDM